MFIDSKAVFLVMNFMNKTVNMFIIIFISALEIIL